MLLDWTEPDARFAARLTLLKDYPADLDGWHTWLARCSFQYECTT